MPLFGTLSTMPLTDLLQWIGGSRSTGTLKVEHNRIGKLILFEEGQIVGCSSDDPPQRLGQFLIARGTITEAQLREALLLQERRHRHLGWILVDMGAISGDQLSHHLEAKAEETILSIFDWPDAVFRFQDGACNQSNAYPVSLRVEDLLLRGLKRLDEIRHVREVFHNPRLVLRATAKRPPGKLFENKMARRLYESIDGERTVADILLHVHGSEYVVYKFLYELHRNGYVEIVEDTDDPVEVDADRGIGDGFLDLSELAPIEPSAGAPTSIDRPATEPDSPAGAPVVAAADGPAPERVDGRSARAPVAPAVVRTAVATERPAERSDIDALEEGMRAASASFDRGDIESALGILDRLYADFPENESLRRMSTEAELAFIEKAYRHYLPPSKVLRLTRPADEVAGEDTSPTEFFLLSRIDGTWDVKSIIQIAPLREIDTLRTLKRMRERGIVELCDPETP